jgi:hypothetical protein
MNGRVYDPLTGGFLSPDPYIQSPDITQNYNRFTYCFNNPLNFIDLTGYQRAGVPDTWWEKFLEWLKMRRECRNPGCHGGEDGTTSNGSNTGDMADSGDDLFYYDYMINNYGGSFNDNSGPSIEGGGGGEDPLIYRIANTLNEFNPIAIIWDLGAYAFTGKDRFGKDMSLGQGLLKAAAIMPIGKIISKGSPALESIAKVLQIKNNKATIEVIGSASDFYKALNPRWNGIMFQVEDGFSLATFKTINGGLVRLQSTSSSTGQETVKICENGYELIFRFTDF